MTATATLIKSAGDAQAYFDEDDYYMRDKAPKQWFGKGAEMLGLHGAIDPAMFGALLRGELPDGTVLHPGATGVHRPGIDLTFSPDKSTTIGALVAGDDRIVAAHQRAVAVALEALEREVACRSRVNGQDSKQVTGNLVVARVMHSVARSVDGQIDPQLHEHCVIMNLTWNEKAGKWQALSNESIFDLQMFAGAIYHAEFARGCRELGYTPKGFANNGLFALEEIPEALCKAMSQRTEKQANEWLEMHGLTRETASPEQLQAAMRWKREAKLHDVDHAELADEWRARAREMGIELKIPNTIERGTSSEEQKIVAQVALHESMRHCQQMTSIVDRHELIQHALRFSEGRTSFAAIDKAIDEVGFVRADYKGQPHYTTKEAQAADRAMLRRLDKSRNAYKPLYASKAEAETRLKGLIERNRGRAYKQAIEAGRSEGDAKIIAEAIGLTSDQWRMVIDAVTTPHGVNVYNGVAGVGKTTLMNYLKELAEQAGFQTIGAAPTHQAKNEMIAVLGDGMTLRSLLTNKKLQEQLGPQHILLPDESSMANSADLAHLMRLREETGCRLFPVGDWRQLPAVEAGSPFLLMQRHLGMENVIDMTESVRHTNATLKAAMIEANKGFTDKAIDMLMNDATGKNRVVEIKDTEARYKFAAKCYFEHREKDVSSFVTTGTNKARVAINEKIREHLGLAGTGEQFTILEAQARTAVELRKLGSYEKGDVLKFEGTYKRLNASKGDQLRVHEVASDHLILCDAAGNLRTFRPNSLPAKAETEFRFKVCKEVPDIEFAVGDEVRFRDTDLDAGFCNGDNAKVLAVTRDSIQVEMNGTQISLDGKKPVPLAHAYCLTVNGAQGSTRTETISNASAKSRTSNQNSFIVQTSRAREGVTLIVDDLGAYRESVRHMIEKPNSIELKGVELPDRTTPEARAEIDRELPSIDLPEPGGHAQERAEPEPEVELPPMPSAPVRERDHGMEIG